MISGDISVDAFALSLIHTHTQPPAEPPLQFRFAFHSECCKIDNDKKHEIM